jgi:hypothetical protein
MEVTAKTEKIQKRTNKDVILSECLWSVKDSLAQKADFPESV